MFFSYDFKISLSMLSKTTSISNKGLLAILQDIAEMHSASIGFGVTDIKKTNYSWALLNWKVKIFERPKYGDTITVKTWSRYSTKLYSYRDFEIYNSAGEIIGIATSKWILIDVSKGKIAKIEDSLISLYKPENKSVFNIVELDKLTEPEEFSNSIDYKIRKSEIDVNNHVNNLCYIDIAIEAFPEDSQIFNSCNDFEILYKHQIKLEDNIKASYVCQNNENYVVIKSSDNNLLHAIVKFY